METNPYLKTELGNIVRSRSELYQNLQLELNLMEERLGEIERVVISLGNGRLNKNLLSPTKLQETLKTIEKQLPSNYSLLFQSNEALWPYYRYICLDSNQKMSILKCDRQYGYTKRYLLPKSTHVIQEVNGISFS